VFFITSFDFDKEVQKHIDLSFSDIKPVNWEKWIDISTNEEYLELSLKLSGLSSIDDILERIHTEKTDSRQLSLNITSFLYSYSGSNIPILCHTSGTTNSEISALKWFHMSKNLVKRNWAPGMQAIFESSGLNTKNSALIFVPSRIRIDGLQSNDGQDYISLYSSEFSQRVMLSIIKPYSYICFEYKNSKNLEIISKILSLDNISVISAPAITILGWANLEKFQIGIRNSLENLPKEKNSYLDELLLIIEKEGIKKGSEIIQSKLSEKISNATIVFSISSLSEQNWILLRKFMNWEAGKEKFTNLYVASEIGPFAASISKGGYELSRSNRMYVFPLTLPVLEYKNKINLISGSLDQIGKLYVSRMGDSRELINIDIGDIVTTKKSVGLPQIDGNIIRSSFELKYNIKLSNKIEKPENYNILAGDFFSFNKFNIIQPRNLLNCLKYSCKLESDALLLKQESNQFWQLILPSSLDTNCINEAVILQTISNCPTQKELFQAIVNKRIKIKFIEDQPIDFLATRKEVLKKVREGKVPKGILKKWPLYVISTH